MGVSNPVETVVVVMALIDEVRAKMAGTKMATFPWRPASHDDADSQDGTTSYAALRSAS